MKRREKGEKREKREKHINIIHISGSNIFMLLYKNISKRLTLSSNYSSSPSSALECYVLFALGFCSMIRFSIFSFFILAITRLFTLMFIFTCTCIFGVSIIPCFWFCYGCFM